ncbi:hypothetical protein LDENG_00041260 [Lucifuga dentata]|nr:hypothetical protein LDENG_00041260 [Lucifuga dentata]
MSLISPIRGRQAVCRTLFGPVDHEQLSRDLKQKLEEIEEQDGRRWNFNFQTETPLPGRYQWEQIPASCSAAFYRELEQPQDPAEDSDRESAEMNRENCSSISNAKHPAEATPVCRKRTKPAAQPRNGSKITDFFVKRRRTSETKSILNPFLTNPSEAAPCKTIR